MGFRRFLGLGGDEDDYRECVGVRSGRDGGEEIYVCLFLAWWRVFGGEGAVYDITLMVCFGESVYYRA